MGKKHHADETEDERKARKRAKKEMKKTKKSRDSVESSDSIHQSMIKTDPTTDDTPIVSQQQVVSSTVTKSASKTASPFFKKRISLVVSLYPAALANVKEHVKESIRSMLLKYADGIGGVLLTFENINIVGKEGIILNELAHIHYTVELDGLVFCPSIGTQLQGVVNECFPSHVGMLVHRFFNAMVSAEHLEDAGYTFDRELQQWAHGQTLKILGNDDCVGFTIDKFHECEGIISMEGSSPTICAD